MNSSDKDQHSSCSASPNSKDHNLDVTKLRPSLPHQAGKAFVRIRPFLDDAPTTTVSAKLLMQDEMVISVTHLVNPQIDPARMAKIFLETMASKPRRR